MGRLDDVKVSYKERIRRSSNHYLETLVNKLERKFGACMLMIKIKRELQTKFKSQDDRLKFMQDIMSDTDYNTIMEFECVYNYKEFFSKNQLVEFHKYYYKISEYLDPEYIEDIDSGDYDTIIKMTAYSIVNLIYNEINYDL